jgi:hypothetical protein
MWIPLLSRQAAGGAFQVTSEVDMDVDNTSPGRVTDLTVTNLPGILRLEFTAPGDDLDSNDAAAEYVIKYSSTASNLTEGNFDKNEFNTQLTDEDLTDSNLIPENGGTMKTINIKASVFNKNEKFVIAMKAADEVGNQSPVSNKVQIFQPGGPTTSHHPTASTSTTPSPTAGCSEYLLFSTSSFPDSKMACYDDAGSVVSVKEDTVVGPGTTCLFLSTGHTDRGLVIELYCKQDHWVVTLTQL